MFDPSSPIAGLRKGAAAALGPLAVIALAACSAETGSATALVAIDATERPDDPPGSALPLSIGGRVLVEDDDEFSAAIRCAAALDLTAQALAVMSGKASGPEVAQIRRAEEYSLKRAVEQSAPDSAATVDAAVARQRAEEQAPHGTVIVARQQSAGRGRR